TSMQRRERRSGGVTGVASSLARERAQEGFAGAVQPRVDSADRHANVLTNLIAGQSLELEHGEDHSLLEVERAQDVLQPIGGLTLLYLTLGRGRGCGDVRHGSGVRH